MSALEFATLAHQGQRRKGNPDIEFITHPIAVSKQAELMATSYVANNHDLFYGSGPKLNGAGFIHDVRESAFLHDVVENTHVKIEEIAGRFGDRIAMIVAILTQQKHRNYFEYIVEDIIELQCTEAIIIKIADISHNISTWPEKKGSILDKWKLAKYMLEQSILRI
jgi:(p)ppGpp synthase/HD superfamily hydrolase